MTQLLIALLKGYKKYISPHLGHHFLRGHF